MTDSIETLVLSDLHTEFDPFDLTLPSPDLVLPAGNIGLGAAWITFARTYAGFRLELLQL
jgi:hypothetical protein